MNSTLNLNKLSLSESLELVQRALQKYPDFAADVSATLSAVELRETVSYDDLYDKFYAEVYLKDKLTYKKSMWWTGYDESSMLELVGKVVESVNEASVDEVYEKAFICLVRFVRCLEEYEPGSSHDDGNCPWDPSD
jgi:hypothetical protein